MKPIKVTVYTTSEFMGNVVKYEGRLISIHKKTYAQYDDCPTVVMIPKGKQKPVCFRAKYDPYLVVVKGYGHIEAEVSFDLVAKDSNGTTVSKSRDMCFDSRYKTDFDHALDSYLLGKHVLVDIRNTKGTQIFHSYEIQS